MEPLPTDDDWYHVNADLTGLKPGTTAHYRLMLRTSAGDGSTLVDSVRMPYSRRVRSASVEIRPPPLCVPGLVSRVPYGSPRHNPRQCTHGTLSP